MLSQLVLFDLLRASAGRYTFKVAVQGLPAETSHISITPKGNDTLVIDITPFSEPPVSIELTRETVHV